MAEPLSPQRRHDDPAQVHRRVIRWQAIVSGSAFIIVAIAFAVVGIIAVEHATNATDTAAALSVHRDETSACAETLQGRWQAAISAALVTRGSEQAMWSHIAYDQAVKLANVDSICYTEHPDPGPDPFKGLSFPASPGSSAGSPGG